MKTMKFLMLAVLLALSTVACKKDNTVLTIRDLPVSAQSLLHRHFKGNEIKSIKKESSFGIDTFEVQLTDGTELEFNSRTGWTEIDCKEQNLPTELLPAAILEYVNKNYPNAPVRKIERQKTGFEIELSNEVEIKFDKEFEVTDIDD